MDYHPLVCPRCNKCYLPSGYSHDALLPYLKGKFCACFKADRLPQELDVDEVLLEAMEILKRGNDGTERQFV